MPRRPPTAPPARRSPAAPRGKKPTAASTRSVATDAAPAANEHHGHEHHGHEHHGHEHHGHEHHGHEHHGHEHTSRSPAARSQNGSHVAHDHRDQARELLRARGLRITEPRLALLTILLDRHRPMNAQELIDEMSASARSVAPAPPRKRGVRSDAGADMDQVTVYRTLNTLVDEGIAQAVGTTERGRRFEVHACEGCRIDHPHLECRQCGALECMEHGLLPALIVPTEVGGYLINEARLYLYGLCPRCRPARG